MSRTNLNGRWCKDLDEIHLAQNRIHLWHFVNTIASFEHSSGPSGTIKSRKFFLLHE
jgi:hypothetical protein